MKILIYAPSFYPKVGGLELNVERLATQFVQLGHKVKLICTTKLDLSVSQEKSFPFPVIRFPRFLTLCNLVKWSNVFWFPCISLKGLPPLMFISRPIVASHHTWYRRSNGKRGWKDWLKILVTYKVSNICISQSIADEIPASSEIIENSYNSDVFYEIPEIPKNQDLIFLGRLVSDKGVDLLLESLHQLRGKGLTPCLTIIGSGPEKNNLECQAQKLEIAEQVNFVGQKTGRELCECLNSHRIMVVPSRWSEPFGVVALEGIAAGCVVVGSNGGGLKSAIGTCGATFPNGDVNSLTTTLIDLLTNPKQLASYRANAPAHLARHHPLSVAKSYLKLMEAAV